MSLVDLVVLGLASATVSVTVAQSKLFKPLRQWLADGSSEWFQDLITCPYCMGHWVSLVLTCEQAYQSGLYSQSHYTFRIGTYWLAVTAISALVSGAIGALFGATHGEDPS